MRLPVGHIPCALRKKLQREGGFALIESLVSTVLLALAFTAALNAIDAGNRSSKLTGYRSAALTLAVGDQERLRSIGDDSITNLLALDDTTRVVAVSGTNYTIESGANYVDDVGGTANNPCSTNEAAQYLKITSRVTWPNGGGREVFLTSYFAPEGGNLQTNTSTLKVFVKTSQESTANPEGVPIASKVVTLVIQATGTQVASGTTDSYGCVLFIGLNRGDYEIRVPETTRIDYYNRNNPVKKIVKLPKGATFARTIQMDTAATVNAAFQTSNFSAPKTPNGNLTVTPGSSTTNLVGPWGVSNIKLTEAPVNYRYLTAASNQKLFPFVTGYTAFSGDCSDNNPDDGNAGNGSELITIPNVSTNTSWGPGLTYFTTPAPSAPVLRVPNLRISVRNNTSGAGTPVTGGQVLVREANTAPDCVNASWQRMPGVSDANGNLPIASTALPVGEYDLCIRRPNGSNWYYISTPLLSQDNLYPGPSYVDVKVPSSSSTSCPTSGW